MGVISKFLFILMALVLVAGCTVGPKVPTTSSTSSCLAKLYSDTPSLLANLEQAHGIRIEIPNTWESRKRTFETIVVEQTYYSEFSALSLPPSKRSSQTFVGLYQTANGENIDLKQFASRVVEWHANRKNVNITDLERGTLEPFTHRDGRGREWHGVRVVNIAHGTSRISRGPYTENIIHVLFFLPWRKENWVVWVGYNEIVESDIEPGKPYSHGLDYVLNRLSMSGE